MQKKKLSYLHCCKINSDGIITLSVRPKLCNLEYIGISHDLWLGGDFLGVRTNISNESKGR